MFSLIIVIIAVALVVLLVLATIYFGGRTYDRDSARLVAHTVINQSGQIAAARQLAHAEGRLLPPGSRVALPSDFIETMPTPPKAAYASGEPSSDDWEYYLETSKEHFGLQAKLNQKTCMELNRSQGFIGIPAAWDGVNRVQCFGPTDSGYTFLYELPTRSAVQHNEAITKAVNDAKPTVPTVRPGYPRLCPDGTTIEMGLCPGGPTTPPPPPVEEPPVEEPPVEEVSTGPAEGYWIIKAEVSPVFEDYYPSLTNGGFSKTCPAGAIDPTSNNVRTAPSRPGEAFNVDSAVDMVWVLPWGDYSSPPPVLERTWCIPALESDVPANADFPMSGTGEITNIVSSATPYSENIYMDWGSGGLTPGTKVTAKGVTWSIIASMFGADVQNEDTGDALVLFGRKVAIGRDPTATETHFVNSPVLTYNDVTYQFQALTITFDPVLDPCLVPVPNAPLGTGGDIEDIKQTGYTSVILKQDGSVWMAGSGAWHIFGNCSWNDRPVWTRVAQDVASINVGSPGLIMMVKENGSVWASETASPVHIKVFDGPARTAGPVDDGLAILKTDGTLWYKGSNIFGQAGIGSANPVTSFVQVDSNVASMIPAYGNIFYIKTDDSLWATGSSGNSHLGGMYQNTPGGWPTTPGMRPLKLADGVAAVSGSTYASFYLKKDGRVFAAGTDYENCGVFGQTPTTVTLTSFTQIAAPLGLIKKVQYADKTVWLETQAGELYAAGCNTYGTFGDDTLGNRNTFAKVANQPKLFSGHNVTHIVDSANVLWAAGYNEEGQFGNGSTTNSKVFVPVQY